MARFIIRHRVSDYDRWKKAYAAHGAVRAQNGFKKSVVHRYVDDPNHLIILFDVDDVEKAKTFAADPALAQKMKEAGVIDEPKFFYLDDGETFPN
ncbi:MAG: cyclase [Candidatus Omnitrophota bacterium]|nr:cyclase [Candidatus Omnitrophota bacterium]